MDDQTNQVLKVTTIRLTLGDVQVLEKIKYLTVLTSAASIIRIALRRFLVSLERPKQS